ncbi:MAG: hypothetical protein V4864_11190 [Pseudomonadota bacterium]
MTNPPASGLGDVAIELINQSTDCNNSQIVIFQKNVLGGIDELPVAWKVLDCPSNHRCRFTYPAALTVSANDEAGNATAPQPCSPGQLFTMRRLGAGSVLVPAGQASAPGKIEIAHEHDEAPIGVRFYRGGSLMASRQTIMPRTRATFLFKPALWIGVVPQATEGSVYRDMPAGITILSMEFMRSVVIHMTGSCANPAQPVQFAMTHT